MYLTSLDQQFEVYQGEHRKYREDPGPLIALEKFLSNRVFALLCAHRQEIEEDYNEASHLFPFWVNYPPLDRGRSPKGDQYPWIEVGERAIGGKLPRMLAREFELRDTGFPGGADERFVLSSDTIGSILGNDSRSAWLHVDIKSVGPRDDFSHTVLSHNQVSADGRWVTREMGVRNSTLKQLGPKTTRDFFPSIPPIVVLSDGRALPVVTMALKVVYSMLPSENPLAVNGGQPLTRLDLITIPNGILLTINPNYLGSHPGLLFPGKDDYKKDPTKVRSRISFEKLREIDDWRIQTLQLGD